MIFLGGGGPDYGEPQNLLARMANRHGLIAGATGTGKTVTLQVLAESFSARGVPVFLADAKGDLSGLAKPGDPVGRLHEAFTKRAETIGFAADFTYAACPVIFWDLYGEQGHPVRATLAEMGPLLLSRLLELPEVQEGVLNIAFRVADEQGLALLDLKDLQSLLVWLGENRAELSLRYGNITPQTVGAIQRRLLVLENEGGAGFFGEPALEISDLMRTTPDGRGVVGILAAERLMNAPRLYATFLLWLLSELFENLPEVGNPDQPKLVFFFDEAHLLFGDAPRALVAKVEQVARLIRSKGVGVYFITQNPDDIPDTVLGQLGNRVQHALRAFTARDQKALRTAAETYRPNPRFAIAEAIRDVGTGEAVTSLLDAKGAPGVAERTLIRPPGSQLGPVTPAERAALMAASPVAGRYDRAIDRESAHEILARRAAEAAHEAEAQAAATARAEAEEREFARARRYEPGGRAGPAPTRRRAPARRGDTAGQAFAKSMARSLGTRAGTAILRGILGGLFRGR